MGGHADSFNRNGWFIGGGVENNLNIFGITAPGWFIKTEYRSAFYDRKSVPLLVDGTNAPVGTRSQVQQLEPDYLDFAGLSLQLGWHGRPPVLISANSSAAESPGIVRGFFASCKGSTGPRSPPPFTMG